MDAGTLVSVLGVVLFGLVVAAAAAAWIVSLVLGAKWEERFLRAVQQAAAERGWSFQQSSSYKQDCIITGQQGNIPWTLTYRRRSSNRARQSPMDYGAVWRTDADCLRDGTLLIYPRLNNVPPSVNQDPTGMASMAVQFMFRNLGIDITGATLQAVGSREFQSRYMILCDRPETARMFLASGVQNLLVNWPRMRDVTRYPSVFIDRTGVSVQVKRDMSFGEMFGDERLEFERQLPERIVALGVAAAEALK